MNNILKIVHLTDNHILSKHEAEIWGVKPNVHLLKVIKTIRELKYINCIINTGDIADHGNYTEYLKAKDYFSYLQIPVYLLQGNHDNLGNMLNVFNNENCIEKSVIINNVKIIMINSVIQDDIDPKQNKARGYIQNDEFDFLSKQLEKDNFKYCIIALHHPPILSNKWTDRRILDNRDQFINLIAKFPKVKAVLYGHQHIEQVTLFKGIKFISSPPTSFHYDSEEKPFTLLNGKIGFGIVEISKFGELSYNAIYG